MKPMIAAQQCIYCYEQADWDALLKFYGAPVIESDRGRCFVRDGFVFVLQKK